MTTATITDIAAAINAVDETQKNMRLFKIAVKNAKDSVGLGVFDFQPTVIKRALVSGAIVTLLNAQDDLVDDARIRRALGALEAIVGTAITDAGIVGE